MNRRLFGLILAQFLHFTTPFTPSLVPGQARLDSTRLFGLKEWRSVASLEPGLQEVCCLPFPAQDCLITGETKELHLYEARFLALFEKSLQDHSGVVAGLLFAGEQSLLTVMPVCDVLNWERKEVGVHVKLRCVGRAQLVQLGEAEEGYLTAQVREMRDRDVAVPDTERTSPVQLAELGEELYKMHDTCMELEQKIGKAATAEVSAAMEENDDPKSIQWGHEAYSDTGFKNSLRDQVQRRVAVIASPSAANGQGAALDDMDEMDMLSHTILSCFDPKIRLQSLAMTSIRERLEAASLLLKKRQKLLAAKSALSQISFEPHSDSGAAE
ncbi:unnamed protein product [Chrysoparadoxa australica]